jgi:tetratricopeptide (TPR) repeat protein
MGYREEKISLIEFVLLFSLITAYFVQNLAVFDSLVTYIPLMMTFGFIYWIYNKDGENIASRWFNKILGWFSWPDKTSQANNEISVFVIAGIIMFFIIYQYNIKPIKMLMGTIRGQEAFAQNDVQAGFVNYKKALSHNTILDRDSRDSLIRLMSGLAPLNKVSKDEASQILEYVIDASQKNLNYNPRDSLALIEHSQLLNVVAEYFRDDKEKFSYYSKLAEEAADKSIESAPGRIPHYFQKTQVYITRGDMDKAIETLKYAYGLNEDYYESVCKLAKVEIVLKKDEGYGDMNECLDKGGAETLYPSNFVGQLINYYAGKNDSARVLKLYEKMAQSESNNSKILANLAQLYAQEGQKEKAVETARKAAELDPAIKDAAEEFIKKLEE